ncbi:Aste57867_8663 [Aphanomyces stellatus]|uniref:Aste57867_8663 protein n=1 Tax=Aphanomyces stellatus TaxID=120398 RepID=A0A485KKV5_9STRA|nr:hypothetical protein As57867_008629 [Aphanomyces stellatus]VFT85549.1 Aste57867_8663 [Aphanomyces stellatus]
MKLPLPPDFFRPPPLSPEDSDALVSEAYECALDVVDKARVADGQLLWTQHTEDGGLRIFKSHDSMRPGVRYYLATAEVEGTLEEAAALFRTDTPDEIKAYTERFGKGLLDAAHLYTLVPRARKTPYDKIGVHWMAIQSPVGGGIFTHHRDACLLECQHAIHATGDRRGWVRALKSVALPCCPDLRGSVGLIRMTLDGTGHVFVESAASPRRLEVFYLIQAETIGGGGAIDWAVDLALKRRCRSLLDLDQFLRENRLSRGSFLPAELLMPKEHRRNCFLCKKKLWLFAPKYNCLKCGEVMCAWCCGLWTVTVDGQHAQIRACRACAQATFRKKVSRSARPRKGSKAQSEIDVPASPPPSIRCLPSASDDTMSLFSDGDVVGLYYDHTTVYEQSISWGDLNDDRGKS